MKSDCSNRIQRCRYRQMLRRKTYNSSHSVTRSVSSGKQVYVANYESKTLKSHLDFILIYYILSTGKRTALEELNTGIVAWVHEFDQIFETFCVSEPRCVERGHAEGQPIQVYLPGNHSIVCMLQWWRRICVRQQGVHSAAFLTQVSKAPSSESLEQGRASDSNQVGETTKHLQQWLVMGSLNFQSVYANVVWLCFRTPVCWKGWCRKSTRSSLPLR